MKIYARVLWPIDYPMGSGRGVIQRGTIVKVLEEGDMFVRAIEYRHVTAMAPISNLYFMSDAESKLAEVLFG